ncbi:hypothetical protein [Streptodolium elevatio]|uniref:Uncharacterized protein n=1 Tax=Streptodolium elevatio TaxID=3157996 RepID=A0ABV3D9Q2_9ACTN
MSDGEGVVDGLFDMSAKVAFDGVQGAADLVTDVAGAVTDLAATLTEVGLAAVKGVWNAPKAVGLKPVPTILAAGAGAVAAGSAGAGAAATGVGISLPNAGPALVGFGVAAAGGVAVYAAARKYRAVHKELKLVEADPELRKLRAGVSSLRRTAVRARFRQTAADFNDRLARRQQRKLMRRAHRLGEPATVRSPANISRKSRALLSTDRRARKATRRMHARRAKANAHARSARSTRRARTAVLRDTAARRHVVRRRDPATLPGGRRVQRMLGFGLGRSKGLP